MKKDTNSYKGWLNSDYFLKRVAAFWGYLLLGVILIYVAFGIAFVVLTLIALAASVVFGG